MQEPIALIGPNAVLQLVAPVVRHLGPDRQRRLFAEAGYDPLPSGEHMLEQHGVARLHQKLREISAPDIAQRIAREAGAATGRYILANRIPAPAKSVLKLLPGKVAARLLSRAIQQHAWTFAGSGEFTILCKSPLIMAIRNNPLAIGEGATCPQCDWHCAVFDCLFNALAGDRWQVHETRCCSMGAKECRFTVTPRKLKIPLPVLRLNKMGPQ